MRATVTTAPAGAVTQDYVEISYTAGSDRFAVISRTTVDAAELLLQSALDQVRAMKSELNRQNSASGPVTVSEAA